MHLRLLSVLLVLLFIEGVANAPAQSSLSETSSTPMRLTIRHIEPKGVGYSHGYTTIDGFLSPYEPLNGKWIPFTDLRGHILNDGRFAANAGIGLRYIDSSLWKNRIWGANTFYDYRKTSHRAYSQVGLGLESLGEVWDFRLNGYLPVGAKKSVYYDVGFDHFVDNFMLLKRKREFVMKGADAEVGMHVKIGRRFNDLLYFAAGPYYLTGGKTAWGGKVRGAIDPCDYFRLEASASYDNVFKWIGQVQLSLSIPIGPKCRSGCLNHCSSSAFICKRAYQRVDRSEIIPVNHKHYESIAINPSTGLPWFFVFVDNQSSSNGTIESPYPTLFDAQTNSKPGDVIYVFEGDGTSYTLTSTFQMQNDQHLWGSGADQSLPTTWGRIRVPPLTAGYPLIKLAAAQAFDIITLANRCEVSGMHLIYDSSNTSHRAIFGSNITDAQIQKNHIDYMGDLANAGISLFDSSGLFDILNNSLTVGGSIQGTGRGIVIEFNTITINSIYNINQNNLIINGSIENGCYGIGTFISSAVGNNNSSSFHVAQNRLVVGGSIKNGGAGIATRSGASNDNFSNYDIDQNSLIINGLIENGAFGIHIGSAAGNNNFSKFHVGQNHLRISGSIIAGGSGILVGSAAVNDNFSILSIAQNSLTIPSGIGGIGLDIPGVGTGGLIFLNLTDNVFYPYPIQITQGTPFHIIQYGNNPNPTGL